MILYHRRVKKIKKKTLQSQICDISTRRIARFALLTKTRPSTGLGVRNNNITGALNPFPGDVKVKLAMAYPITPNIRAGNIIRVCRAVKKMTS